MVRGRIRMNGSGMRRWTGEQRAWAKLPRIAVCASAAPFGPGVPRYRGGWSGICVPGWPRRICHLNAMPLSLLSGISLVCVSASTPSPCPKQVARRLGGLGDGGETGSLERASRRGQGARLRSTRASSHGSIDFAQTLISALSGGARGLARHRRRPIPPAASWIMTSTGCVSSSPSSPLPCPPDTPSLCGLDLQASLLLCECSAAPQTSTFTFRPHTACDRVRLAANCATHKACLKSLPV